VNYRHAFHAGNFADVLKHAVLMRVLEHLKKKEAPFRAIDLHAGDGFYDLRGDEAARTGEWIDGIGRLARPLAPAAEALLAPYRAALADLAPLGDLYPGSPAFIRHALRDQDRAAFNELHPEAASHLRRSASRDPRIAITSLDAYTAWKAQVPPKERRGLVLVDPPFEVAGEFDRIVEGTREMARKWAGGTLIAWYPIKNPPMARDFERAMLASGFAKLLVLELHVDQAMAEGKLSATGLILANPPFTLHAEMELLLPALAERLARRPGAGATRCEWLLEP
jgi:23S rRNA (adenine2030-N6)-methyltransferase